MEQRCRNKGDSLNFVWQFTEKKCEWKPDLMNVTIVIEVKDTNMNWMNLSESVVLFSFDGNEVNGQGTKLVCTQSSHKKNVSFFIVHVKY